MAMIAWNTIDGVPVHYARDLVPALRNEGKQRSFESTRTFKNKLDATFAELWEHCGLGKASAIVTAGAFVNKTGKHGQGEAFDLDGIVWHANDRRPERRWWAIDHDIDAAFYWGVGGILNRHMRFVLHARYDADHLDHYHVDDTTGPRFSTASSAAGWLQAALTFVHAIPVVIDKKFGPQTAGAAKTVLERLGLGNDLAANWLDFNLATAKIGMSATGHPGTRDSDREDEPQDPPIRAATDDHERPRDEPGNRARRLKLTTPRMRGDDVKRLQDALKAAGQAPGRSDGIFGRKTDAAVRGFQASRGLEVDGIVGPVTAAVLGIAL